MKFESNGRVDWKNKRQYTQRAPDRSVSKLYSYIVTHDTGFSPNPFWGWCTLACCKPSIRRSAAVGDWVVGLNSRKYGNGLVYAMAVEEILPFAEYYTDRRFRRKIPSYSGTEIIERCGDNIYEPMETDGFRQLRSAHSNGDEEDLQTKQHDLGGKRVLISRTFWYWGREAVALPNEFEEMKVGRAHKCRFPEQFVSEFITYIKRFESGIHGRPAMWPEDDQSWQERVSCGSS